LRRLLRPTRSIQDPAIQSPGYIDQSGQQRQRTGHQHHYEEYTCQITAHRTRELQTHDGSQPHGGGWRFPVGTVRDDIRQREIYERHRQKVDAEGNRAETQALVRRAPDRQPGQQPEQNLARHEEQHHEDKPNQSDETQLPPHEEAEEPQAQEHGLKTVEPAGKNSDQTTHPANGNGNTRPSEGR
jgi:hypothetical protein